ncbi:MAG: phosphatidylglycerophosphatase A [Betaproteobacteria bacterium]|nr:phosphatidylglycerophosphatase A [Betaproteobacteria bacterium]
MPTANPDAPFLVSHPAHFIALGGGAGLVPKAPGTFGTLLGFPLAWASLQMPGWAAWLSVGAAFLLGVWACERCGRDLGVADHGAMVWDEVVAMWGVLLLVPLSWVSWLAAFALFRFFDIAKPFPIGWLDRKVKGGLGVMLDDALAAAYAVLALRVMQYLLPGRLS